MSVFFFVFKTELSEISGSKDDQYDDVFRDAASYSLAEIDRLL
jgi:hypothetical protein